MYSGLHRGCTALIAAKRLHENAETTMLSWLEAGRRIPNRDHGAQHKAQTLVKILVGDNRIERERESESQQNRYVWSMVCGMYCVCMIRYEPQLSSKTNKNL